MSLATFTQRCSFSFVNHDIADQNKEKKAVRKNGPHKKVANTTTIPKSVKLATVRNNADIITETQRKIFIFT